MAASEKIRIDGRPSIRAKPSVNSEEPLASKAAYHDDRSSAQYVRVYPTRTSVSHTTGSANKLNGA